METLKKKINDFRVQDYVNFIKGWESYHNIVDTDDK